MKTRHIILILVLIALAVLGYVLYGMKEVNNDGRTVGKQTEDAHSEPIERLTEVAGSIEQVEGIELKNLQVLSLGSEYAVANDGTFSTVVDEESVNPVIAFLPDVDFGFMAISIASGDNVSLSLESTARSMVFLSPQLMTTDPQDAQRIMDVIAEDAAVAALVPYLEKEMSKGRDPLKDSATLNAYGAAIESVFMKLYGKE